VVSAPGSSFLKGSTERELAGPELVGHVPPNIPAWAAAPAAPRLRTGSQVRGAIDAPDRDGAGKVYEDHVGVGDAERTPAKRRWSTTRAEGLQQLLTVADAARILNVSERTVRRLIASGSLCAVWIGRSVRLRPRDIERLIAEEGVCND
jgi:excisionase family DNA binding protein